MSPPKAAVHSTKSLKNTHFLIWDMLYFPCVYEEVFPPKLAARKHKKFGKHTFLVR